MKTPLKFQRLLNNQIAPTLLYTANIAEFRSDLRYFALYRLNLAPPAKHNRSQLNSEE